MAAFNTLDWTRLDVWAIVSMDGIAVVEPKHQEACLAWLRTHGHAVSTIDFLQGIGPAVIAFGELFRWKEQFGYALGPESRILDALRDGFEFDVQPGRGVVLELMNAGVAYNENPSWFAGLLSIAREHSRVQLALGARFFTLLILSPCSALVGTAYEKVSVPSPFRTAARHGDPFSGHDETRPPE